MRLLLLLLTLIGSLSFSLISNAATVRLAGSDLLSAPLHSILEAEVQRSGIELEVDWSGSFRAAQRAREGTTDIVLIATTRPETNPLEGSGWTVFSIAYKPILVGVHPTNPLEAISLPELAGIFGVGERLNLGRWGELGAEGIWDSRPINLILPAGDLRVGADFLQSQVMQRGQFRAGISRFQSDAELAGFFRANLGAIGVLPRFPGGEHIRLLSVRLSQGESAYNPSESNLHFGDYPLRIPFLVALSPEASPEAKALAQFLLSEEVAAGIRGAGLAPVPSGVRQGFRF